METYKCILHFINDQIGEFMYKIEGKTIYPLPTEIFQWSCRTLKTLYKTINIPFINECRENTIKFLKDEDDIDYLNSKNENDENINEYIYKVINIIILYI